MSYRDLEIWKLAREVAIAVHRMTLQNLPKFEMFEEASQIRRSAKSISANIVEGYGRRRYKQEFIRFLVFAHASCDETIDHLEVLFETGSLTNEVLYRDLSARLDLLGRKLNVFIDSVGRSHRYQSPRYPGSRIAHYASRFMNLRGRAPLHHPGIQLAPLVDVLLLLLIFFLLTWNAARTENELDVKVPKASAAKEKSAPIGDVIVNVKADGNVVVNRRTLTSPELQELLKGMVQLNPEQAVVIRGDEAGAYKNIVEVLNICTEAGITNVAFATAR